ncbi:MAG: hypothetical protein MRY59_01105 [Aquisalinus sp.]|nr:hypothetical protein [Aquisalinus sp.]
MVKILSVVWVLLTVVINAFALAGLLSSFGIAAPAWQGLLGTMNGLYTGLAAPIYNTATDMITSRFDFTFPAWSVHALLAYAATASAVAVSGMGIARREDLVEGVKASGFSLAWPVGIVFLIWKAIRFRLVSKFTRDHGLIVLLYFASVAGVYFGAAHLNGDYTEEGEMSAPIEEASAPATPA